MPNGSINQLRLRNAHGQMISTAQSKSPDAIQLDALSLPLDIYILELTNESGISQIKILKKYTDMKFQSLSLIVILSHRQVLSV
ncbi:MAG: T9SS type A sorting domain-containing protein [Cyclobacteriaceae bacterium]